MHAINNVKTAINELKDGRMIILCDDGNREDEADMVLPAEIISSEQMNFMIQNGSGIVCLSLFEEQLQQLNLPLMVPPEKNTSFVSTPFTLSIDANNGTSGVSAADRTATVKAAIADNAKPHDITSPGHIFPLLANSDGVFARRGHTEGSIDIVRLAGYKPGAVICELMNRDGTMMRGKKLKHFAKKNNLFILNIDDIITYRYATEDLISESAHTNLPLEEYGNFKLQAIREKINNNEHIILSKEFVNTNIPPLVRIHSACTTGDLFASKRCDCHKELHYSLQKINEEGGILIYLNQEGRGIGLFNKIKAYELQDQGLDTVEANEHLGLPVDSRRYHIAAIILRNYGINQLRLLTNNPEKIADLKRYGIETITQENMPVFQNEHNYQYLLTKKEKLNHTIVWSNL